MLSIGKLTVAQTTYYEGQVARGLDDYYTGRGEAPGRWAGTMAGTLGLAGDVEEAGFAALMAGADPASGEPLVVRGARSTVAAYDLTFSAPKSVSVLFAIADHTTAAVLVEAHEEAVAASLEYLEGEACRVRRGHGGLIRHPAAGFVAAAYRHRMSRAEDPHLHTHVVTANAAHGEDGRWSALDGRALYAHAKAAGFVYQAHLRAAVRERLTWLKWGAVRNGMAEISVIPSEVLAEFSTRRRQILERERELESAGVVVGHRGRERLVHDTRKGKRYGIETGTWRQVVRARAAEHGLGSRELASLAAQSRTVAPESEPMELAEAERLVGPGGLTEKRNTFRRRDVVMAFAAAHGQGVSAREVLAATRRFVARGDVQRLGEAAEETALTTAGLLACERAIVQGAERRQGERVGVVEAGVVARVLAAQPRPLNSQQAAVLGAIAASGRGVETVEALAGTGKTTTAGALADVYRQAGYDVLGVAPTARAVRELKEQARIGNSWTLAGLLARLDRYADRFPGGRSVLILDEAGMASTREVARLLDAAERSRVKVVAIGDPGQLPSVLAGGWLGSLGRHFGAHHLREVMRQRDLHERRSLERLHAGDPDEYLESKERAGLLHVFAGEDGLEAERAVVSAWRARQAVLPAGQAVMVCRDNARRRRLNQAARTLLADEGQLGPAVVCGRREFAVGDRVICRRNAPVLDVDNGTRGTVVAVDTASATLTLRQDPGATRVLPARYCAEYLEYAYTLTAHAMQGATVEWAAVAGAPEDFTRNWAYTALSRSREPSELYITAMTSARDAERAEFAPTDARDRVEPLRELLRAMRQRNDDDLALDQITAGIGGQSSERAILPLRGYRHGADRTLDL